jgi:CubicO group peptidase (beta-lactamase class C family)
MKKILLGFGLLFSLHLSAQSYFPEPGSWEKRSPDAMGLNADSLQAAVDFALAHEYGGAYDLQIAILQGFAREPYHKILGPTKDRGQPAGLILKDGYIVAEWGDVRRVDMTFSVTKSYLSTVAGLAVDAGLIRSTQDKLTEYVWDGTFEGEHNGKINWDHLLTQSSDWTGTLFGLHDWADRPPREGGTDEWKRPTLREPGTAFEYNDVRVNVLAYSLLQVWRQPLPVVLKEKIMDPIGASTTWRWYGYDHSFVNVDGQMIQSVSGGGHSGGGLFINTLDHARFGLLFLRNGKWNGEPLLSPEWIEYATSPSEAEKSYAAMWWTNHPEGSRHMEGVPASAYYAAGFGGNYILIDPEHDLVLVTRWLEPRHMAEMARRVINALE